MSEKMSEEKSEETSVTRFDERKKELVNTTTETKTTELGTLSTRAEGRYHEEGIKKVLKGLELQKKSCESRIELLKERVGPAPEYTKELELLEENTRKIMLINYKKKLDEKGIKKDKDDLESNEKDLKRINKDITDIRGAIGTRMNLED